jgi:hypothetical protein
MVGAMPEHPLPRKMWRTLEPYHALAYFTPQTAPYEEIGVKGRSAYFASRSAPLGAVPVEVVIATFFNFHPDLVRRSMAGVWEATTPGAVVAARFRVADAGLRAVLGDEVVASAEVAEAADLARTAAEAVAGDVGGRCLYAGHVAVPWPDEPHLVLWNAITLLREYRGDGHVAALLLEGLDPCEALVSYGTAGDIVFPPDVLRTTRAWSDDEWAAATNRLRERGWLDAAGASTPLGAEGRDRIEQRTDESAARPWDALGREACDRLRALVRPFSTAIARSGTFTANPLA